MFARNVFVFTYATILSLCASIAAGQYVAPGTGVPYDAPPQTLIPRAGSIGRALTPPTYYRSAPQFVPTTVHRPVTAYHPVTGQPYTRWDAASTYDVETQRVATPLPGYGAPFAAYRSTAPVVGPVTGPVVQPSYYAPQSVAPQMNVQGWSAPYSGGVVAAPVTSGYATYRPVQSVAPAYAVGRPVMGAPVVSPSGAWPFAARRPAFVPMSVQYAPVPRSASVGYAPTPVYRAPIYPAPTYGGPAYGGPAYAAPTYAAPVYGAAPYGTTPYSSPAQSPPYADPNYANPSYSNPVYGGPAYGSPASSAPAASDPYYSPRAASPAYGEPAYGDPNYTPSGAPADYQPSLRANGMSSGAAPPDYNSTVGGAGRAPNTASPNTASTARSTRPLVPATESRATITKPAITKPATASPEVNWPRFLPNRARQPAPATLGDSSSAFDRRDSESSEPAASRVIEEKPAIEYDPEVRPLRDPNSRIPDLNDHRAPPLTTPRSTSVTAPIRRLTLTPNDNVTGHTANPASR